MEEFPYYSLTWLLYFAFSASFLWLSYRRLKDSSIWLRLPLMSFIFAFALTPGPTLDDQSWLSPAAIIMIFELVDKREFSAISSSVSAILLVWLLAMIVWSIIRFLTSRKKSTLESE